MINVSVLYNGGLLPNIRLLTYNVTTLGNPFNTIESFCPYNQCSHLNILICSEDLDAFRFFFKQLENILHYLYILQ